MPPYELAVQAWLIAFAMALFTFLVLALIRPEAINDLLRLIKLLLPTTWIRILFVGDGQDASGQPAIDSPEQRKALDGTPGHGSETEPPVSGEPPAA